MSGTRCWISRTDTYYFLPVPGSDAVGQPNEPSEGVYGYSYSNIVVQKGQFGGLDIS